MVQGRAVRGNAQSGRNLWRRLLAISVLLLLLLGTAIHFRVDVANRWGPRFLSDAFRAPIAFTARDLDWRTATIASLDLGADKAVRLEGIHLSYDPWQLRLDSVEIDRVTIFAELGDRFSLGDLDPIIDDLTASGPDSDPDDASGPLPALPRIVLKKIDLSLRSPVGTVTGSGQATLDSQSVIANFSLGESNGGAALETDVALSLAPDGVAPSGALSARIDARSALWAFFGLTPPASGALTAAAQIRADADWQQAGWVEADWRVSAEDFHQALLPAPLSGSASAKSRLDRNGLSILDLLAEMEGGLAPGFQARATGKVFLRDAGDSTDLSGKLHLAARGDRLALAPLGAADIELTAPEIALDLDIAGHDSAESGTELTLRLAAPASLKAKRVDLAAQLHLVEAMELVFQPGEKPFATFVQESGGRAVSRITTTLGKASFAIEPAGAAERLILAMPTSDIAFVHDSAPLEGGPGLLVDFATRDAQAVLPLRGIAMAQIDLNASHSDGTTRLKLTSGAVTGLGAFVPVTAVANAVLAGDDARFDMRFRGVDQPIDLTLKGRADIARLKGEMAVALAPVVFAEGGLQPYNLFPPLRSHLENISGRIEANGPVRFDGGKLSSDLKLGVQNFSGKVGPVELRNVNSVIEIDRPWPLSTKPDQAIAIARADIGLPLTNALFRFKISDGKRLDIAESRLAMSGGEVQMDPVSIDIDSPVHNIRLTAQQISVNELFASLGIAGLTGEGTLSGVVPVSLFPGGIAIPHAELKADAPGVLRYDRNQAPAALLSAGESVAMALEALSDFHYKDLILSLSRELTGDVDLGLHISGSNPSFYDGYPVEFNLSVEGRLDEALRQGLAGYQVPDMIQEQLENLAQ